MEILVHSFRKCNSINIIKSASYSKQAGNAMKKLLGGGPKKKLKYNDTPMMPNPSAFSKGAYEGKQSSSARRVSVLNKTFMRYITDLMATGECAPEIIGHGIEINKVNVTPDYKFIHVYWIARGNEDDEVIDKVLTKNAGLLRHELSQLRVMGVVPKLTFMKDKQYSQIVELDNRLSKADFGDDYIPAEPHLKLKSQLELFTSLDLDIKNELKKMEKENDGSEFDEPLPPMPQNVLGLNHSEILSRIQKTMKKSEAIHRISSNADNEDTVFKPIVNVNEDPVEYGDEKSQRLAFREFLHKRQISRFKNKSEYKNYIPDLEYIEEEHMEKRKRFLNSLNLSYKDDEDYIIEYEELEEK